MSSLSACGVGRGAKGPRATVSGGIGSRCVDVVRRRRRRSLLVRPPRPLAVLVPRPPFPSSPPSVSLGPPRALRYDDDDDYEEEEEEEEEDDVVVPASSSSSSLEDLDDDDDDESLLLAREGMDLLYAVPEDEEDDDDDDDSGEEEQAKRRGASTATATEAAPPPPLPLAPLHGGDQRAYVDAVISSGAPREGGGGSFGGSVHPKVAAAMFRHPLDRFQRRALRASLGGRDVVVCAPTGAGKTAIAAAAALGVLAAGKRVVYTTPLKALSNQKLQELRELFGDSRVGLQTGDATVNAGAPCVVMTTEVLRNILLRVESTRGGEREREEETASPPPLSLAEAVDAAAAALAPSDAEDDRGSPPPPSSSPPPVPLSYDQTSDVGLVVLDEVHYLGDPSRGTTWEEVIMSCPPGARILAMSATVRNPGDLGAWIGAVHGGGGGGGRETGSAGVGGGDARPTAATAETIVTSARPVPLTWMYAWSPPPWYAQQQLEKQERKEREEEENGWASSPSWGDGDDDSGRERKKKKAKKLPSVRLVDLLAPLPPGVVGPGGGTTGGGPDGSAPPASSKAPPARLRLSAALRPKFRGAPDEPRSQPAPVPLARELERRGLLPAIWFVFSRAGCDATATAIGRSRGSDVAKRAGDEGKSKKAAFVETGDFLDDDEGSDEDEGLESSPATPKRPPVGRGPSPEKVAEIDAALAELERDQPEAVRTEMVPALRAGVASHHAGCLPGWKQLVERLFQSGCLDVVVATETLAAGINMPARTTVVSSLYRRRGPRGVEQLTHNELLQMAGRAGRRGYDSEGACVLLHDGSASGGGGWGNSLYSTSSPDVAAALLARGPERLASRFRPSYSMALNLLASRPLSEARAFVERSFGAWLRGEGGRAREGRVEASEAAAREAREAARELRARLNEAEAEATAAVAAAVEAEASASASAGEESEREAEAPTSLPPLPSSPPTTDSMAAKKAAKRALKAAIKRAVARRAARAADEAQKLKFSSSSAAAPFELFAEPWSVAVDLSALDANGDEAVPALAVGVDWAPKEGAATRGDGEEESSSGSDVDDVDVDDASSPSASSFAAVPRTREPGEPRGELLCLLADNRVARVQFAHVAGVSVAAGEEGKEEEDSTPSHLASSVVAAASEASATGAWKGVPGGTLAASGTAVTAEAAASLGAAEDISLLLPSADEELEMRSARTAVREARAASRRERREAQRAGTSLRKQRRAREAAAAGKKAPRPLLLNRSQQRQLSRLASAASSADAEAQRAERTAAAMRAALEEDRSATWKSFEAVVDVLESVGAVERSERGERDGDDDPSPPLALTPLGEVARGLAGENELWLATVLTHESVQALTPPELAAALSAVAAGEATLRPGASAPYPPSKRVLAAVAATEEARARIARAQASAGVDAPLALDLRLSGVVEAWASGAEWAQAAGDAAGLDAGDVARMIQRTVDLLRQAGGCGALPPGIRRDARRAAARMYRPPISDLVQ